MTQFITSTCLLLVDHFLNIKSNPTGYGFNSRVFSYDYTLKRNLFLKAIQQEQLQVSHHDWSIWFHV